MHHTITSCYYNNIIYRRWSPNKKVRQVNGGCTTIISLKSNSIFFEISYNHQLRPAEHDILLEPVLARIRSISEESDQRWITAWTSKIDGFELYNELKRSLSKTRGRDQFVRS